MSVAGKKIKIFTGYVRINDLRSERIRMISFIQTTKTTDSPLKVCSFHIGTLQPYMRKDGDTPANRHPLSAPSLSNVAITAKISNVQAFIYSQKPHYASGTVATNAFYTHYCGANKIKHHSWGEICDCVRANLLWMLLGYSSIIKGRQTSETNGQYVKC